MAGFLGFWRVLAGAMALGPPERIGATGRPLGAGIDTLRRGCDMSRAASDKGSRIFRNVHQYATSRRVRGRGELEEEA